MHCRADVGDAVVTCIARGRSRRPGAPAAVRGARASVVNGALAGARTRSRTTTKSAALDRRWPPFDPRLPALAATAWRSSRAGSTPRDDEPVLIGYKPRRAGGAARRPLRAQGVRAHAREFDAALTGLDPPPPGDRCRRRGSRARCPSSGSPSRPPSTGPPARVRRRGGCSGRRARGGPAAGAARRGLDPEPPSHHLGAAIRKAELISAVDAGPARAPGSAAPTRLGAGLPSRTNACVPAHGDFHVDQLLIGAGEIAVVDFDQMCLAAPALDIATYAADVVRGRDGRPGARSADGPRPAVRGLRAAAGRARVAPVRGHPRPCRAPVPPPAAALARAGRGDGHGGGGGPCLERSSPAALASSART